MRDVIERVLSDDWRLCVVARSGKLKESEFPFLGPSSLSSRNIVIYIVGGFTYEEVSECLKPSVCMYARGMNERSRLRVHPLSHCRFPCVQAMVVDQISKASGVSIILGGSRVHNSSSFISELTNLEV